MKIYNKAKWILGILMVFILILSTNLIDKNNFVRVKDSVVAIYEDRLVAKGLIFDMSRDFHEKEIAAIQLDTSFYLKKNKLINSDIEQLIARFKETKLTKQEGIIFTDFEDNFTLLKESETTLVNSNFSDKIAFNEQISKIK
ncbi:MCP four helix bundle domain-containing protein, partial [Polaribacter sp.]|uniref:MCP four helix bundle domain-containing protein n=1 Tax=Polaribacter sp. TaxID=1920175 RepID=UPI003F6ABEF0